MLKNLKKRKINLLDMLIILSIVMIFSFSQIRVAVITLQGIVVAAIFIYLLLTKKPLLFHRYALFYGLFLFSALITTIFTVNKEIHIAEYINVLLKYIYFLFLGIYISLEDKIEIILLTIVGAATLLLIHLLITTPIAHYGKVRLGYEIGINSNMLGLILSFGSILSIHLFYSKNYNFGLLLGIIFALFSMMTGSRKAILLFSISLVIIILLNNKTYKSIIKKALLALSTIVLVYLIILYVPAINRILYERIQSMNIFSNDQSDVSFYVRDNMMNRGIELFKVKPLFGYGLESFRIIGGFDAYSHSNYIEILVSSGMMGLIAYYTVLLYTLWEAVKARVKGIQVPSIFIAMLFAIIIIDIALVSYRELVIQTMLLISLLGIEKHLKNVEEIGHEI